MTNYLASLRKQSALSTAIQLALLTPGMAFALPSAVPGALDRMAAAESIAEVPRLERLRAFISQGEPVVAPKPARQFQATPGSLLLVTSALDDGSSGTLRAAIAASNASFGARDTIVFDPSLAGASISLTGPLELTDGVDIRGPEGRVRIAGSLASESNVQLPALDSIKGAPMDAFERVFVIGDGVPGLDSSVTMERLEISGGRIVDYADPVPVPFGNVPSATAIGAGIYSSESLSLRDCLLSNNSIFSVNALASGSALFVRGGDLTLQDSVVTGNSITAIPTLEYAEPMGGTPAGVAAAYGSLAVVPAQPTGPISPAGTSTYRDVRLIDTSISRNYSDATTLVPGGASEMIAAGTVFYANVHAQGVVISENLSSANMGADPDVNTAVVIASALYAARGDRNELFDSRISNNAAFAIANFSAQGIATVAMGATINDIQRTQVVGNVQYALAMPEFPDPDATAAVSIAGAAGVFGGSGQLTYISDSTIAGNFALGNLTGSVNATGGDVNADFSAQVLPSLHQPGMTRITNSTLSDNHSVSLVEINASVDAAFNIVGEVTSASLGAGALLAADLPAGQPSGVPGAPVYGGEVLNSTIADNVITQSQTINYSGTTTGTLLTESAQALGGGLLFLGNGGLLVSSIVDGNGINAAGMTAGPDIVGDALAGTNNIVSNMVDSSLTDGIDNNMQASAQLAPLANNGGPTPTRALSVGSPAIDAGSNPMGLATDQRGNLGREVGAAADVGAFECGAIEFIADTLLRDGFDLYCK